MALAPENFELQHDSGGGGSLVAPEEDVREPAETTQEKEIVSSKTNETLTPASLSDTRRLRDEKQIDTNRDLRVTSMPEPQVQEPKQEIDISGAGTTVTISVPKKIEQYPSILNDLRDTIQNSISGGGAKEFEKVKPAIEQSIQSFASRLPDSKKGNEVAQILTSVMFHQGKGKKAGRTKIGQFTRTQSADEIIGQAKTKSENSELILYGALALGALILLK